MYSLLANETAESLRTFLVSERPEITPNWWTANIIPSLSF